MGGGVAHPEILYQSLLNLEDRKLKNNTKKLFASKLITWNL